MNEEQAYAAVDALQAEIKIKQAEIYAIVDELNMRFVIQCEWTKDYRPNCAGHIMAGTMTYYAPYTGQSRAMSLNLSYAKKFKSRRDAQWYLDECLKREDSEKRHAEKLNQIWSVVSIPHESEEVK